MRMIAMSDYAPISLLAYVAEELRRRILAPLAAEAFFCRQQIAAACGVEPIGIGPALVHAPPRIRPVVVDLAAEQMAPDAPHVFVPAELRQIFVVLEDGVDVGDLERHVIQSRAVVVHAEQRVVVDVLVAAVTTVERADDVLLVADIDVIRADEAERVAEPLHGLLDLRRAEHAVANALDG